MKALVEYVFFKRLTELSFVEEIWLYGSRARGDNHSRSDIDIALVCPRATKKDWLEVLQIVYCADTLLYIDCIRFDKRIPGERFREVVLRDKKILYLQKDGLWRETKPGRVAL